MRKLNRHRIPVLFCVFALLLTVAFLLARRGRHRVVTLPDGLSIEFLGVTVGTNRLPYGSPLQRILANHIPQGLKLGPWTIPPPTFLSRWDETDAHAWLVVRGLNRLSRRNWFDSKVVTSNRFSRQISIPTLAASFSPNASMNEVVLDVPLVAFPRNDHTAILRFSPPTKKEERLWIEFPFRNPLFTAGSAWTPPPPPVTNRFDGQEFILSSASDSRDQRIARAVGTGHVVLTLPSSDWQIPYCRLFDNEGNSARKSWIEGPRNGKVTVWFDHSLETNRPWRVEATFARGFGPPRPDRLYSPEQLRTAHLTAAQPATLTNNAGEVFTLKIDARNLFIESPDRLAIPCWAILSAKDENNIPLYLSQSSEWESIHPGSGALTQTAHLDRPCSSIDLRLACPPSFTTQFFVFPEP